MKTTQKNKKRTTKRTLKGGSINTIFNKIDYEPLLDRFDVFAWDFDETLMTIPMHLQSTGKISEMTIKEINTMDNEEFYTAYFMNDGAKEFIELVLFLKKHKKHVAIISSGYREIVEAALNKIFKYYYTVIKQKSKNQVLPQNQVLPFYYKELKELKSTSTNNIPSSNTSSLLYSEYKAPTIYGPDINVKEKTKEIYIKELCTNFNTDNTRVLFFDDNFEDNIKLNNIGVSAFTVPGQIYDEHFSKTKNENKNNNARTISENIISNLKPGFSLYLLELLNNNIESIGNPSDSKYSKYSKASKDSNYPNYPKYFHESIFTFDISSSNTN
jgi:hypothetical protein